jgi:hypothetical protein
MAEIIPAPCLGKPSTTSHDVLDILTEELKAEFARLKQSPQNSCSDSYTLGRVEIALDLLKLERGLTSEGCINRAKLALDAVEFLLGVGVSDVVSRQKEIWTAVLVYCQGLVSQLKSLLARSFLAVFGVPLFMDGPELSGYKHRLR